MRRAAVVLAIAAALLFGLGATLLLWRRGPWPEPVDTGEWRLVGEERNDSRQWYHQLLWQAGIAVDDDEVVFTRPRSGYQPVLREDVDGPVALARFRAAPGRTLDFTGTGDTRAVVMRTADHHVEWSREVGRAVSGAMSEDGRRLLLFLPGGRFQVFDLPADRLLIDAEYALGRPFVRFSPDGRRLLLLQAGAVGDGPRGSIWDLDTGEVVFSLVLPKVGPLTALELDGGGGLIALEGRSGSASGLFLIDVATGETRRFPGTLCGKTGTRLAILDAAEGEIRVARPGPALGEPIAVPSGVIETRAARGSRWLALRVQGTAELNPLQSLLGREPETLHGVVLMDLEAERVVLALPAESAPTFAFSPSGRVFAALERSGRLRIWREEAE